ncbi:hypothetical protein [Terricaulis silvestris]|uniref:Uncharacterized protein n=1 Tax=Terricaulis silvestris TaxID=2686094 RepID=A0A6I6MIL0_9CAUL|nr:hypothetical protein [Terricaulis silvestris]QGZ93571.1 hypothetical protein DSM104635_00383 [Terricaulis silvestris]
MRWLYRQSYFGPDRRSNRFQVRFFERRHEDDSGTRASLMTSLKKLAAQGLRWVDHFNYFGPDRRGDAFSYFFLERRRHAHVGTPPPLHAALRQLRVRVLEVDNEDARKALRERITATAILADAQGRADIGDLLTELASKLDDGAQGLAAVVQSELLRAAAMLGDIAQS